MRRTWSDEELRLAVSCSRSFREVLLRLGLRGAGGNYRTIQRYVRDTSISTMHFSGSGWRRGSTVPPRSARPLEEILRQGVVIQSFKLKKRLFDAGLKARACEECGWAKTTADGYLPLELDHMNGDTTDNRLENLRVLCPNCHSLKPTHRGRKLRGCKKCPGGGTVDAERLKRPERKLVPVQVRPRVPIGRSDIALDSRRPLIEAESAWTAWWR
jgi:hypothetical protein